MKITIPMASRIAGQALAAQCFLTSTTFSSPAVDKMYLSTCGSSQLTTPMANSQRLEERQ